METYGVWKVKNILLGNINQLRMCECCLQLRESEASEDITGWLWPVYFSCRNIFSFSVPMVYENYASILSLHITYGWALVSASPSLPSRILTTKIFRKWLLCLEIDMVCKKQKNSRWSVWGPAFKHVWLLCLLANATNELQPLHQRIIFCLHVLTGVCFLLREIGRKLLWQIRWIIWSPWWVLL